MNKMTYYDEISEGYEELHLKEQINKLSLIDSEIKIKKSDKLLDVGCGSGISTRFWSEKIKKEKGGKRIGIDPSKKLIEIAKQKDSDADYEVGVAEKLPFEDDTFDKIISVTAIHNFSDVKKALSEIKRVGKAEGRCTFVITVLKKSAKAEEIKDNIINLFKIKKVMIEDKDIIFLCL